MIRSTMTVLSVLLFATACGEQPTAPTAPAIAAAKGLTDPTPTWKFPTGEAGLGFASDGQYASGGYSAYANGTCGVSTRTYSTTAGSGTGDATIQLGPGTRGCRRMLAVKTPDGTTQMVQSFANLNQLENASFTIPIGTSALRRLIINPGTAPCGRIILGDNGTVGGGTDRVEVSRLASGTWDIHSQSGANVALCENTGELYAMPVHFVISLP